MIFAESAKKSRDGVPFRRHVNKVAKIEHDGRDVLTPAPLRPAKLSVCNQRLERARIARGQIIHRRS